jgi:deoxyribodipyrimidine photo-lyase
MKGEAGPAGRRARGGATSRGLRHDGGVAALRLSDVPSIRIRAVGAAPVHANGAYVLYWMTAARRTSSSFALDRAVAWARELGKPLAILEAVRIGYRWASERLHRFVLDGMAENARRLSRRRARYYPYVEPTRDAGRGLLESLAAHAAVVVTDDFPCFFVPRMLEAAGRRLRVRLEAVDGNGLLPLRASDRAFPTAFAFRRFLQRTLPAHLGVTPTADPFVRVALPPPLALPASVRRRWPPAALEMLGSDPALARLSVDHAVRPVPTRGGSRAGQSALARFVADGLPRYADERNEPEKNAASGLSPYLHFGHVSTHEVLSALARRESWSACDVASRVTGGRSGWWRMSASAEAFLDELVTWRELGFNMCWHRPDDYDRYESLPAWARRTLAKHRRDRRPWVYDLAALETGRTHDALWNAAQRQLVREGRLHNYLRMLWGKKILEWSPTPQDALSAMIELNNKYALDGRDPNSYSGIFWVLGRYDRGWGPERPIFGTVRYMSSESTARKVRVRDYLKRYGAEP